MRATIVLLSLLTLAPLSAQTLRDEFDGYPAGSDARPGWQPDSAGWEVADGGYLTDGGTARWRAAPYVAEAIFSCDLTVLEVLKGEWLTAGIGLVTPDDDGWIANLVMAPEAQNRKPFLELHERYDGRWLAEGEGETRLERLPSRGDQFAWQVGRSYRFRLTLAAEQVTAEISEAGQVVGSFGYRLPKEAAGVRMGRPVLRASGFRVRFDNAELAVRKVAPEPAVQRAAPPAWASRPGTALVKGSGFFRPVEVEGRWWMVDPEGKPFYEVGTDHVNYRAHWCQKLGYAPYHRNAAAKYGSEEAWAEAAASRLKSWGFNTLPAGHSPSMRHRGLPHILFASFGAGFAPREWLCEPIHWTGYPDVFSPRWERHCRLVAERIATEMRGDPWCIGVFLDNELEWYGKKGSLVDEVFARPAGQPGKQALLAWLLKRYGSLTALNEKLGTAYADQAAFLAATAVPPESSELRAVRDGFLAEIAERYFGVASRAMKAADPDHLVMGCRFAGRAPDPVLPAAGKYTDVFTINSYPRVDFESVWGPDGAGGVVQGVPRQLTDYYAVVKKPMIITEWSFPALDSGLPCQHGAGMRVDTQDQKAACYRVFANAMADLPFMVGYHYFMWADEPALGISDTFPEDSNYGLVNEQDLPYEVLTRTAAEVNSGAAERHARSAASDALVLRAGPDGPEVSSPSGIPSHGRLWVNWGRSQRIEELRLEPGGRRTVRVPGGALWVAELQLWDGSKVQAVGGAPIGAGEVVNTAQAAMEGVPVVVDEPAPAALWVARLEPGQRARIPNPDQPARTVERVELQSGEVTWLGDKSDGSLFSQISATDLPLGRLVFAVHQKIGGQDQWVETDTVETISLQEQRDAWLVEAVVSRAGRSGAITAVDEAGRMAVSSSAPGGFRARVRAMVFKRGGLALVKPLSVENTDSRPWVLDELFWFCRPAIGGNVEDDQPGGPKVPNYYAGAQFWTDRKLGGVFAAAAPPGTWQITFWQNKSGGFHPDARFPVTTELAPGGAWRAEAMPYLWIYADRDAARWRALASRIRQAGRLIVGR